MAHLILFTDANFRGAHKHIFDRADVLKLLGTLSNSQIVCVADCDFPDSVSSIAILDGNWRFFQGPNQASPFPVVLGPGLYPDVNAVKLLNDNIRSMIAVDEPPSVPGIPLNNHVILFEHANFHGDHLHLFAEDQDLGGIDFDNRISSFVVELGGWSFYSDTMFDGSYPKKPVFGPGIYPWVQDVSIGDNSISSLRPSTLGPTISNAVDNEIMLFQYAGLYGPHKHVFVPEPNLNADDDDYFNDNVGSLVVLRGNWSFYSDWNFAALYGAPVPPGVYRDLGAIGVAYYDMSSLRPAVPETTAAGADTLGHVILFQEPNFHGPHKHIFNQEDNLNADEDDSFNDEVSSLAVLSGNWQFFRNSGFDDDYPEILGPGLYSRVQDFSIRDNDMSSLRAVPDEATVSGDPINAHVILFENASFHGAHKHVFNAETNLNADDDSSFNDIASSIVVVKGNWATYGDWHFDRQYPSIIGPGVYSWVEDFQITDNDMTSLQASDASANVSAPPVLGHIMLFEHSRFRGAHKHVFNEEKNLNADDDDSFNDVTSSIAVLQNEWLTYRDAGLQRAYDVLLGEGLFSSVQDVGITDNDLSSLTIAGERRQFSGQATIKIASGKVPDPVVVEVAMTFLFYPDTRRLLVENGFSVIAIGTLGTISYDSAGDNGTFGTDGQITIPDFKVTASSGIFSVDATILLSTGNAVSPTGRYNETGSPADSPADGLGNCTLVGAGQLAGDDFSVILAGVFTALS